MKFQPDRPTGLSVTAYSDTWIAIDGIRYPHSLIIGSNGTVVEWPEVRWHEFGKTHLALITDTGAEIVLIGCAQKQDRPEMLTLIPLMEKGIGTEIMDTAAACRTYNVLAAEGRRVAAVLMLSSSTH